MERIDEFGRARDDGLACNERATGTFLSGEILWESIMARVVDRDEPWHDIPDVAGRGEAKTNVRKVADSDLLSTSQDLHELLQFFLSRFYTLISLFHVQPFYKCLYLCVS